MPGVHLETYGCQMNRYDSELVRSILSEYPVAKGFEDADYILLNTCAVRENAYNKIRARVGDLNRHRKERGAKVGILGCMAEGERENLLKTGQVDFVVGPDRYRDLPRLLNGELETAVLYGSDAGEDYSNLQPERDPSVNAWIAIMRGCNNFCAYCVVPLVRGRERSRPLDSVVREAVEAAGAGRKQITLLGQNVNSYRHEGKGFADLLKAVAEVPGIERIRFTSSHPKDFPAEVIDILAAEEKICPQVQLSLQSGSTEVLRRMNRGYTREDFLRLSEELRNRIPGVFLSTDIIVGFPGETAEQFEETRSAMRIANFESSFIFKYSPRKGTLAQREYEDDVSEIEKTERIVQLNEDQKLRTAEALGGLIGKEAVVLLEDEQAPLGKEQCQGRIPQGVTVVLPAGAGKSGDMIKVKITDKTSHVLLGEPL